MTDPIPKKSSVLHKDFLSVYPKSSDVPCITDMAYTDYHVGEDNKHVQALSLYSGYGEIAYFPVDAFYAPTEDAKDLPTFKIIGFTYEEVEDITCEDNEGHYRSCPHPTIILAILHPGEPSGSGDGDVRQYEIYDEAHVTPHELMTIIDTLYSPKPLRGSRYDRVIFR